MTDPRTVTAEKAIASLFEVLEDCQIYFDNKADADCDQDGFIPNREMELLIAVKAALSSLDTISNDYSRFRLVLDKIERTPAWGAPDRWDTTPTQVRQLARSALSGNAQETP